MDVKTLTCTVIGAVGGAIASIFGGWDAAMTTLIIFMCIDYLSGLIVAGVFHASRKTDSGALESRAGWKGLCRKGMILLIVLIENAGLMGVPMPSVITKAIDVLAKKAEKEE